MKMIAAAEVKRLLAGSDELALLDVREHGQYGEGHPFFSVHLPYSLLEARASALLPCRHSLCVVFDDDDGVAVRAAHVLEQMGYANVAVLAGGTGAWTTAGFTLFKGVNVPSKAFGELVEHELHTRSLTAPALKRMLDNDEPVAVFDGRAPAEFRKMSIPGARSCPNAELGYRVPTLVPDTTTPVVVNCAGRTRSIIGAATLQLLELANPVYALKNGTQGWRLAGFELNHGCTPEPLPAPAADSLAQARDKARTLITRYALPTVSVQTVQTWLQDAERNTYLFDVRTAEEFAAGCVAGAIHAPGGQLVQATDEKVAVRGARIVVYCDTGLRAATTAIWLRGMGHQVSVLLVDGDAFTAPLGAVGAAAANEAGLPLATVARAVQEGAVLLDASRSMDYRSGHIDGARWVTRARLAELTLPAAAKVVVVGRSEALIAGVVTDLSASGVNAQAAVAGNPESWRAAGLPVVATPEQPADEACIDFLFFVHDRHDGNLEAARRYLAWELGLVDQLDAQERAVLCVPQPAAAAGQP